MLTASRDENYIGPYNVLNHAQFFSVDGKNTSKGTTFCQPQKVRTLGCFPIRTEVDFWSMAKRARDGDSKTSKGAV